MQFELSEAFARKMDEADPLRGFRERFHMPTVGAISTAVGGRLGESREPCVYLVGNSLGLQPRATRPALEQELIDWERLGVEGHFHPKHPWLPAHEFVREHLAKVVGAQPREVVAMNSLTANLHFLCASFYRPTRERYKIVIEDAAFPSDSYAMQSQLEWHAGLLARAVGSEGGAGFDAAKGLIRLKPREGEEWLRTEDVLATIDREKDSIAMVMLGGVNYRTGQFFDMPGITRFARERGIVVGWDLAHAAGNIDLKLHDWGPDFAAWCSYKYLNSGPGAIAGAFVHERHLAKSQKELTRLAGWWGNDPASRFKMGPEFTPVAAADAWQLSNPPIMALTPLRVSLEEFASAGMERLCAKSLAMTRFFEQAVGATNERMKGRARIDVLTPTSPSERGCQLSLRVRASGGRSPREVHKELTARGVVTDFREPDVIRAAPVPLYNSFHDVWRFVGELREVLEG